MSSHHIVRDDQEPALVIDDFDAIEPVLLDQLLEWSPTVLVGMAAFEAVVLHGRKVDVLITDIPGEPLQDHVKVLPLRGTLINTALTYLIGKAYPAVTVIADGIRPESLLPYVSLIRVSIITKGHRYYAVSSGFSQWKPKNEIVYIVDEPSIRGTTGLTRIGSGCFRTNQDGFYSVAFDAPYGIIGETL